MTSPSRASDNGRTAPIPQADNSAAQELPRRRARVSAREPETMLRARDRSPHARALSPSQASSDDEEMLNVRYFGREAPSSSQAPEYPYPDFGQYFSQSQYFTPRPYQAEQERAGTSRDKYPRRQRSTYTSSHYTPYSHVFRLATRVQWSAIDELAGEVQQSMQRLGEHYDGKSHADWALELYRGHQGKLSLNELTPLIMPLYESVKNIKNWTFFAVAQFFTLIDKLGFFGLMDKVSSHERQMLQELHFELAKNLADRDKKITLDKDSMTGFVALFSLFNQKQSSARQTLSNQQKKKVLSKIADAMRDFSGTLSVVDYKNILHEAQYLYENEILRSELDPILKKIVKDLANIAVLPHDENVYCKSLIFFSHVLKYGFTVSESTKAAIEKVVARVKGDLNVAGTIAKLSVVARLLRFKHITLSQEIEETITADLRFLEANLSRLTMEEYLFLARNISTISNSFDVFPRFYKKILNFCLDKIEANKERLSVANMKQALSLTKDFYYTDFKWAGLMPFLAFILRKFEPNILAFTKSEAKTFLVDFSKTISSPGAHVVNPYIASLSPILKQLVEKHSASFVFESIESQVYYFSAIANIMAKGLLPNAGSRHAMRRLFNSLNTVEAYSAMPEQNKLFYLRSVALMGRLFEPDLRLYTDMFTNLFSKLINDKAPYADLTSLLWSILAFSASHRQKLVNYPELARRLDEAISRLYTCTAVPNIKLYARQTRCLAAVWLNKLDEVEELEYDINVSNVQHKILRKLQTSFPDLAEDFVSELPFNGLPPCDISIPDKGIFIEVQGPHHYLDSNSNYLTGRTELKNTLYERAGYRVIEVDISDLQASKSYESCVKEIRRLLGRPVFNIIPTK